MTSPTVMQAIADRAGTNPAYTQPIRLPRPQQPPLSQCHKVCRELAVFVCGVTAGVLLQRALEFYFPAAYYQMSTTFQSTTARKATLRLEKRGDG